MKPLLLSLHFFSNFITIYSYLPQKNPPKNFTFIIMCESPINLFVKYFLECEKKNYLCLNFNCFDYFHASTSLIKIFLLGNSHAQCKINFEENPDFTKNVALTCSNQEKNETIYLFLISNWTYLIHLLLLLSLYFYET